MRDTNEILQVMKQGLPSVRALVVFSLAVNVLMLTPLFYMMNVFDKAVAGNSLPTLVVLAIVALFAYACMGLLDWVRSLVMSGITTRLDLKLAPRLYKICFEAESGFVVAKGVGNQPLQDLNSLRMFLGSTTAMALFDVPFIPLYFVLMILFHPILAVVALVCIVVMAFVAIMNQRTTSVLHSESSQVAAQISNETQINLKNAEVAAAMGMVGSLMSRWQKLQGFMLAQQRTSLKATSGYTSLIKVLSMIMQGAAITTGAVLALAQEVSPGVMIAAALLLGRSMGPIQAVVTGWKQIIDSYEQYNRLVDILQKFPERETPMALPKIEGRIAATGVSAIPPKADRPVIHDITFDFAPGTVNMIIGPSAAGKSTIMRVVLGIWPTSAGSMRIDGAEAHHYDREALGPQIGYLPQDIELFDGSVAENIARFDDIDPDAVVLAAKDAGVHELILSLPKGYETKLSPGPGALSPGQRQRVGLARALYRRPKLMFLDEPNSNLDEAGDRALYASIEDMKARGATVVVVSHRHEIMPLVDHLILMENGKIKVQGARDKVVAMAKSRTAGEPAQPVDSKGSAGDGVAASAV